MSPRTENVTAAFETAENAAVTVLRHHLPVWRNKPVVPRPQTLQPAAVEQQVPVSAAVQEQVAVSVELLAPVAAAAQFVLVHPALAAHIPATSFSDFASVRHGSPTSFPSLSLLRIETPRQLLATELVVHPFCFCDRSIWQWPRSNLFLGQIFDLSFVVARVQSLQLALSLHLLLLFLPFLLRALSHLQLAVTSSLASAIESGELRILPDCHLPNSDSVTVSPYVMVADDAFALRTHMMKPCGSGNLTQKQRVFNYRLSRARRVVENAFGIMCSRFRVFSKAIPLSPENVQKVVMASCCLHNYLLRNPTSASQYMPDDPDKTSELHPVTQQAGNRASNAAMAVRDDFCHFFDSDSGSVSWQLKAILRN